MKNNRILTIFAFALCFMVSAAAVCNAQKTPKAVPAYVKPYQEKGKMEKPKYEITATQNGTELGKIIIETFPEEAPLHAKNFDSLVEKGFYNGTMFHRVISGFMIQGGDPNTKDSPNDRTMWGMGKEGQATVKAEFNAEKEGWSHRRGMLSMARKGNDINSGTSQFFIMHQDGAFLDGQYSIFGQVLEGIEVVDKIATAPKDGKDAPNDNIAMTIKKIEAKAKQRTGK